MIISRATKVNSGFISVVHNGFYKTNKITNVYTMFKSKDKEFVFAIKCAKVVWYLGWHLRQAVGVEGKKLAQPKAKAKSCPICGKVCLSHQPKQLFIAVTTFYLANTFQCYGCWVRP